MDIFIPSCEFRLLPKPLPAKKKIAYLHTKASCVATHITFADSSGHKFEAVNSLSPFNKQQMPSSNS